MRTFAQVSSAITALLLSACSTHGSLPNAQIPTRALSSAQAGGADQTTVTYVGLPAPFTTPYALLVGPDGALWFGETNVGPDGNKGTGEAGIGRLTTDGSLSETPLPTNISPFPGAFDASGNLWFSDGGENSFTQNAMPGLVGVLRPNGDVSSYPIAYRGGNSKPRFSVAAPDGNVWYALQRANEIARVAPDGSFTTFRVPPTSQGRARPQDIVFGPDGALWFTEWTGNAIGRMTLEGALTNVYELPTAEASPRFLAVGTDGALWIAEGGSEFISPGDNFTPPQIVRMTTMGQITNTFAMPPNSAPDTIRAANGGFVFADEGNNAVGFIDYSGNVVEYPLEYDGGPLGDAAFVLQGSDGCLYFADSDLNRIGKITLGKKGLVFPQDIALPTPRAANTQLVGVAISGDRGPFTATTDNPSVATVAPIPGFPMNFMVTAVASGTTTLEIKGKGKPMSATITVTAGTMTQSIRRHTGERSIF